MNLDTFVHNNNDNDDDGYFQMPIFKKALSTLQKQYEGGGDNKNVIQMFFPDFA